jgi:hypothetical protein
MPNDFFSSTLLKGGQPIPASNASQYFGRPVAHGAPALLNKPNQLKPYCPDCGSDQQPSSSADNPGHFGSFKHLYQQLIPIGQN